MTPLAAATATVPPGTGYVLLAAVVLAVVYVVECAWWPFAACRRCKGEGKFRRGDGKVWRKCRKCKGSGERVRIGRRFWDWWVRTRREAG